MDNGPQKACVHLTRKTVIDFAKKNDDEKLLNYLLISRGSSTTSSSSGNPKIYRLVKSIGQDISRADTNNE